MFKIVCALFCAIALFYPVPVSSSRSVQKSLYGKASKGGKDPFYWNVVSKPDGKGKQTEGKTKISESDSHNPSQPLVTKAQIPSTISPTQAHSNLPTQPPVLPVQDCPIATQPPVTTSKPPVTTSTLPPVTQTQSTLPTVTTTQISSTLPVLPTQTQSNTITTEIPSTSPSVLPTETATPSSIAGGCTNETCPRGQCDPTGSRCIQLSFFNETCDPSLGLVDSAQCASPFVCSNGMCQLPTNCGDGECICNVLPDATGECVRASKVGEGCNPGAGFTDNAICESQLSCVVPRDIPVQSNSLGTTTLPIIPLPSCQLLTA